MRNTIILGLLVALFGFAAAAQASDRSELSDRDGQQVSREASIDNHREGHDRYERSDRSRARHDESREGRYESREGHDEYRERQHRR